MRVPQRRRGWLSGSSFGLSKYQIISVFFCGNCSIIYYPPSQPSQERSGTRCYIYVVRESSRGLVSRNLAKPAQDVWSAGPRKLQKGQSIDTDGTDFLEILQNRCSREEAELCAWIAWGIWTRRNTVLHGGVFTHPNQVVRNA